MRRIGRAVCKEIACLDGSIPPKKAAKPTKPAKTTPVVLSRTSGRPVARSLEPHRCTTDRYNTHELAERVVAHFPGLDRLEVEQFLDTNVNSPEDRVPQRQREYYPAELSISAFEASIFLQRLMAKGRLTPSTQKPRRAKEGKVDKRENPVAVTLENTFFQGGLFYRPRPRLAKIYRCHDADTCDVLELDEKGDPSKNSCSLPPATIKFRFSGTDAPEKGEYDEKMAIMMWAARIEAEKKRGGVLQYPFGDIPKDTIPSLSFVTQKFAENIAKVHFELALGKWDPKNMDPFAREIINSIIAETINYTGKLSELILEDYLKFDRGVESSGRVILMESEIRWTSGDTPATMCGTWQPYDANARRLASFLDEDSGRLAKFIKTRLPVLMTQQGPGLYQSYKNNISRFVRSIPILKDEALKAAARLVYESTPDPQQIYSSEQCRKMTTAFEQLGTEMNLRGINDVQAMQIITGSVYPYMKYRNSQGDVYERAGQLAEGKTFGLWSDITFRKLWQSNLKIPRYNPTDCKTRR